MLWTNAGAPSKHGWPRRTPKPDKPKNRRVQRSYNGLVAFWVSSSCLCARREQQQRIQKTTNLSSRTFVVFPGALWARCCSAGRIITLPKITVIHKEIFHDDIH